MLPEPQKLKSEWDKTDNLFTEDVRIAHLPLLVFSSTGSCRFCAKAKGKLASSEPRTGLWFVAWCRHRRFEAD